MNARVAIPIYNNPQAHALQSVAQHWQDLSWQKQMANLIDTLDELCDFVQLNKHALMKQYHCNDKFGLKLPHAFAAKIKKGDINDPLLKQILPSEQERITHSDFVLDPLAESHYNPISGLLHKYQSRILITLTGACAVHCRYCFRRHFDYQANLPKKQEQTQILAYLEQHKEVDEVILSGGDPLNVNNRRLFEWLDNFKKTPIKTVRLHTRLPIVLPARIDDELLAYLANYPKNLVMVIHSNHPNEIDDLTANVCHKLRGIGVTLLNQSVLLKGINDDADILANLSQKLFDIGVFPYYLHLLDKVAGSVHFNVSEKAAVAIYWQLLEKLSGYLVPKLVQELPNFPYKTPINIYQ